MKILSKGVKPRRQLWNGLCITEGMFWGDLCEAEALDSRSSQIRRWNHEPMSPLFWNPQRWKPTGQRGSLMGIYWSALKPSDKTPSLRPSPGMLVLSWAFICRSRNWGSGWRVDNLHPVVTAGPHPNRSSSSGLFTAPLTASWKVNFD